MTHQDPVCGMPVAEEAAVVLDHDTGRLRFCSEFCRQQFLRHPRAYVPEVVRAPRPADWPSRRVAYFSMEVALESDMPTYSGGLGVLAGDTLRSCADLEIPVVGISLVHRRGYFRQEIHDDWQVERDAEWTPEGRLQELEPRVKVEIEARTVQVRAWRYDVPGSSGHDVPVLLLDADLPVNADEDRRITDRLYGGDARDRLMQEIVLGVGGVRLLRALGSTEIGTYHLNEGHAALAPLELLRIAGAKDGWDFGPVRRRTVFTTHTPVAAGHDQFDPALVSRVLGDFAGRDVLEMLGGSDRLNMTALALNLSHYVNGVALRHREVSSELFPRYEIHQITNGVHPRTWTSAPFKAVFDRHIPGWRGDPMMLHNALALPEDEVWQAHERAKAALAEAVARRTGRELRRDALTIGFARRATAYKRPGLVFGDLATLRRISREHPLQFVFAGKAHPRDEPGKHGIQAILRASRELADEIPVVYLSEYDLDLALTLVSGVDVWLNTPLRPFEASGTSGMKAALNGVPSLSVLDGWWREGCVEDVTGWAIGGMEDASGKDADRDDSADLYDKLERVIGPMFHRDRSAWIRIMRQCIALNGSFFSSDRMVRQYALHAYSLDPPR
ncbi:MAG: alpha-glucan family phosphorylase [Vicinamibacterales bacterium]